jgi:hypothetical protein
MIGNNIDPQNPNNSTGPTSAQGKRRASLNSLSHCLTAQELTFPGDLPADSVAFIESVRDELRPVGPLEESLVARITAQMWHLRRIAKFNSEHVRLAATEDSAAGQVIETSKSFARSADTFFNLHRYEIAKNNALKGNLVLLRQYQRDRRELETDEDDGFLAAISELQSQPHQSSDVQNKQ